MVDLHAKRMLLSELVDELHVLSNLLELDPKTGRQLAPSFKSVREEGAALLQTECTFEDLKEYSRTLESLLHPSFREYAPATFDPSTGRFTVIPGTERYEHVVSRVAQLCFELRTTGAR